MVAYDQTKAHKNQFLKLYTDELLFHVSHHQPSQEERVFVCVLLYISFLFCSTPTQYQVIPVSLKYLVKLEWLLNEKIRLADLSSSHLPPPSPTAFNEFLCGY